MHPAIKILSLIIVSIFLTQGSWLNLIISGALLLPFYLYQSSLWHSALKMLFKLKWFFISILLIYYFYTPDIQQSDQLSYQFYDPSVINDFLEKMNPGFFRISVLICILFSVNLLIRTTSKEDILSALVWLFSPLKYLNINFDRFLLRSVLTL